MLRSESNLLSRTHWWKVQSSMAIDCFPLQEGAESLLTGTGECQKRTELGGYPIPKGCQNLGKVSTIDYGKLPGCSFLTQGSLPQS